MSATRTAPGLEPVRLASFAFARAYATTMRPYLLFVSGITGIVGMALIPGVPALAALGIGLAFFASYGFGQALTDCFQLDTDSISAPYRPLVRGTVRREHVIAVSIVGLVAVGVTLTVAHPWNLPLVGASIVGLATYTWFKRRWWAGPFYNAWIVAVLMLTGVLAGLGVSGWPEWIDGSSRWATVSPLALAGTVVAVFFGYANFVLAGYFKDISADRLTGYETLPVRAGRSVSCLVSDGFALVAVSGALVAADAAQIAFSPVTGIHTLGLATGIVLSVVLVGAGILVACVAQVRLHAVGRDDEAHHAIVLVVHAYLLLLAGVAMAHRPAWSFALVAFLAAYFVTMRSRPAREQI